MVENYKKSRKGRKIWYSIGQIRGKISSLRIKKVAKNSPGLFLLVNSVAKKKSKITKSWKNNESII
jgi:hypothetical protein